MQNAGLIHMMFMLNTCPYSLKMAYQYDQPMEFWPKASLNASFSLNKVNMK